jgi:hypothetical protein
VTKGYNFFLTPWGVGAYGRTRRESGLSDLAVCYVTYVHGGR